MDLHMWEFHMYPRSNEVLYVHRALLTGKCSGLVGLTVWVHYVCTLQGGSQHPLGLQVNCFIGNCCNLPWLIDRLYIQDFFPLTVGHHSTHVLKIFGHLEAHNMHQHRANDQNPQSDDLG
jgi:hypothetical protein